jgi:hypothetical protein
MVQQYKESLSDSNLYIWIVSLLEEPLAISLVWTWKRWPRQDPSDVMRKGDETLLRGYSELMTTLDRHYLIGS